MAAALTLLIGSLLPGVLCGQFEAFVPQTIEVLSGSCVTIPCSFDVRDDHESDVDSTCKAIWKKGGTTVFDSSDPGTTINGELTGDLTKKDCTTTLNNMQPANSGSYFFRLECSNALRYGFHQLISISVNADPPRPTLTPSTLKVKEGTSVNLMCSAPAPCLSHPPTLTWTSGLYNSQETLQENRDKTKVKTSVVNFPASLIHHGKTISCTATYNKQDGSTESSVSTSLTADISFAPQILHSSDCTTAAAQLNCSCRTVGNPPPTIQWYLDGLPVNHSGKFVISNEDLNGTGVRSIITVNQPQERDLSTLLCHSSNSLGSASLKFHVYSLQPQTSAQSQDRVTLPVFITTVVVLLVLVSALLFVNRAQKTHHSLPKCQCRGETGSNTMKQLLTSGEGNEVPNTTAEDIHVPASSISEPDSTNLPSCEPNNVEGASKSSEKKNEEGSDVIYSTVTWRNKSKKEEDSDEVEPRNVEKEAESEYAQVQFKDKSAVITV